MYVSGGEILGSLIPEPSTLYLSQTKDTHTHPHTQGYPGWPAGASRPLRELKAREDEPERGEREGRGEAECTVASTGEENVECIVKRLTAAAVCELILSNVNRMRKKKKKRIILATPLTLIHCINCHKASHTATGLKTTTVSLQ